MYFRRATFFRLRLPLYFIFLLILFAFILSQPKKNRKRTEYPLQNEKKGTLLIFYLYIYFQFHIFASFTPAIVTFFGHYMLKCCFVGRLIYFSHWFLTFFQQSKKGKKFNEKKPKWCKMLTKPSKYSLFPQKEIHIWFCWLLFLTWMEADEVWHF